MNSSKLTNRRQTCCWILGGQDKTSYFLHRHRDRIHRSLLWVLLRWHYHLTLCKTIHQAYANGEFVSSYRAMRRSFFKEILPASSSSNSLKAFKTSSRESRWSIISAATVMQETRKSMSSTYSCHFTYQFHGSPDMWFDSCLAGHSHAWVFALLLYEHRILTREAPPRKINLDRETIRAWTDFEFMIVKFIVLVIVE